MESGRQNTSTKANRMKNTSDQQAMPKSTSARFDTALPENMIYGRNALRELLAAGRSIDKVLIQRGERDGSLSALVREVRDRKLPVIETDKSKLDALTGNARHQGVVAYVAEREYCEVSDILDYAAQRGEAPLIVICDGVEDPHNLGAIIRTADCVGAHGVIIPKRRSVGVTPTVVKASAGAAEHMRIAKVTNIATTLDELKEKGIWIYAADMDGKPYYQEDLRGAMALVMGSEGFGISRLVKEKCDFILSIPLYGRVNSLNVSNAAAVLLCEAVKQRNV
jgi:23S rRNA (guanosine2251-2'-O)-methyltransferase